MKTIGFVTQKGGAGKSTSALALAGALAQKYRVLLVDLDRQRSIERWSEGANLPETLEVFTATQANDLRHLP
ncbi:nucleotide-binding protein, partial [Pseudomonas savastanoi]